MFLFWRKVKRAYHGFINVVWREDSIRLAFGCCLSAVVLSVILRVSRLEFLSILILSSLVIITESLNTILERVIDLVEPRYKTLIGEIKDGLAGAVLLAFVLAALGGVIIFWPYARNLFSAAG